MTAACHFVTFGGGEGWRDAAHRLAAQAIQTGLFAAVHCFTDLDLVARVPAMAPHWAFVTSHNRGFGYWIWKPCVIGAVMDQVESGDVVCYLDAGCEFLPGGHLALRRMIDFTHRHGAMTLDHARSPVLNCIFWTKADLWDLPVFAGLVPADRATLPGAAGGALMLRATPANREFVATWFAIATEEGYRFVDDTPSRRPARAMFFEHRHDQSIFGLLRLVYRLPSYGSALDYDFIDPICLRVWPSLARRPFIAFRNGSATPRAIVPTMRGLGLAGTVRRIGWAVVERLRRGAILRPIGETERTARAMTRHYRPDLERLGLVRRRIVGFPRLLRRRRTVRSDGWGWAEPQRGFGIHIGWLLKRVPARHHLKALLSRSRRQVSDRGKL